MKRFVMILAILMLLGTGAFAEGKWEVIQQPNELPIEVAQWIPPDEKLLYGYHVDQTIFLLVSVQDEYRLRIFRRSDDSWTDEAASLVLPAWEGIPPTIRVDGSGKVLYLQFTESYYASIVQAQPAQWKVSLWYQSNGSEGESFLYFFPNSMQVVQNSHDTNKAMWIYGTPKLRYDLQGMDFAQLLGGIADWTQIIDTTGWGVVQSVDGGDTRKVYATPDEAVQPMCELFVGAPVRIVQKGTEWTKIAMEDMAGWLPTSALAEGVEMVSVERRFPQVEVCPSDPSMPALLFAQPDATSQPIYTISAEDVEKSRISVIGRWDQAWLLVYHQDGFWGCMEAQWFYPGNG